MTFDKINIVLLTLVFLIPGYLIQSVFSYFTIRRTETKELLSLRFLTFSTLNLALCFPWIIYAFQNNYLVDHPFLSIRYFLSIFFAVPITLGFLIGIVDHFQLGKLVFDRLGICALHSIPTGWDFKFHKASNAGGTWVLVTMTGDREIYGFFGKRSLASTTSSERDLYLESAWEMGDDGVWTIIKDTDGVLITKEEIKVLHFFKDGTPVSNLLPQRTDSTVDHENAVFVTDVRKVEDISNDTEMGEVEEEDSGTGDKQPEDNDVEERTEIREE